jgi:hypothetical protein
MSRQELMPEPPENSKQDVDNDNSYSRRYGYRASRQKRKAVPKEEPPSTFEESLPPYAYQAQDNEPSFRQSQDTAAQANRDQRRQQGRQRFSPDGDALEHGYRPYTQYNNRGEASRSYQRPPWLRPQRNMRTILRWIVIIIVALALIKFIPLLIIGILALIGIVAFAILLPILILVVIVVACLVVAALILMALGVPIGPPWLRRLVNRRTH